MVTLGIGTMLVTDVELVIFDKDGTLMDLYHYWSQMIDFRAKLICSTLGLDVVHRDNLVYAMGVDEANGRLRPDGPVGVKPRSVVMGAAVAYLADIGRPNEEGLCTEIFKEVDVRTSSNPEPLIRPILGVHRLFDELSRNGVRTAIATTDIASRAELAMDLLGLSDKISLVVGADMVKQPKPDPEMIELIVNRLAVAKSNTVMVGDAMTDVEMGINAGLRASVGVCSGLTPHRRLSEATPYVVQDISELSVIRA